MPGAPPYPSPRLRGDLIRAKPLGVEEEARIYAPEAGWYPAPRVNRIGAPDAAAIAAGLSNLPRGHLIPFSLIATAGNRTSRTAGPFTGPAVIRAVVYSKTGTPHGTQGIGLGTAPSAVSEDNVANSTPLPFTALNDQTLFGGGSVPIPNQGDETADVQASLVVPDLALPFIVNQVSFFLVIYVVASTTGGDSLVGTVALVEQVSPTALQNFL
jgi:hypothetical protein